MVLSSLAGRSTAMSLASVVLAGCSLALDTSQVQCETSEDCAARGLGGACVDQVCVEGQGATTGSTSSTTSSGGEGGGATTASSSSTGSGGQGGGEEDRWACLGDVEWPTPDPETMVTLRVTFRGAITETPPPDLSARFCSALLPTCDEAIVEDVPVVDGAIEIQVPGGTRGYFEITGPTIRPAMLFFPRPAAEGSTLDDVAVTLVTENEYQLIVSTAGFEDDPERGTLLTVTTDCDVQPAVGVRIQSSAADEASTTFYFIGLTPDPEATQTDVNGYGGIFNLPAGSGTVEGYVAADDRWIGVSSFYVRPGWLSNVSIEPTPTQ